MSKSCFRLLSRVVILLVIASMPVSYTHLDVYKRQIGMWVTRLGLGYILADLLNMALIGAWIAVTVDMAVRMVLVLKRFSSEMCIRDRERETWKELFSTFALYCRLVFLPLCF